MAYSILSRNPGLGKYPVLAESLETLHPDLSAVVNLLVDFAFYSGVGIKTTTGMGMMQRVH